MAAERTNSPSRVILPALDSLRGIAVLLVMVHNLTILDVHVGLPAKLYAELTNAGWIGVQLFFVLSGFLITGILLDARGTPRFFRNFYVRRIVRIFPLYYAALIVRFAILPRFVPDTEVPFTIAIWFWLYLSNWSALGDSGVNGFAHFWSLAVEEQFYLAWPLAVSRLSSRGLAWCCVALIALSAIARVVIYLANVDPHWLYLSTITRADALAFGALVALAIRSVVWRAWLTRWHLRIAALATLGTLAIAVHTHGLSRFDTEVETIGYTLIAILFAALIARYALDPTPAAQARSATAPLRAAGKYSYAAYVFHAPLKVAALYFLQPWLDRHHATANFPLDVAFVASIIVASFACALVSWAVLERPLLRLKERWAPRATPAHPAPASPSA